MRLHEQATTFDELQSLVFEEKRAFLQRLADAGMSKAAAARRIGRDRTTVHKLIDRYGVSWEREKSGPPKGLNLNGNAMLRHLSKQEHEDFRTLRKNGFTVREALTSIKRTDLMEEA